MWAPDLLHWALAGFLLLGILGVLWCARRTELRQYGRKASIQAQALERKLDALRRVEERHRSFVEQAPVGIFQTRPSGRFLSANQKLAKLLGYASAEDLMAEVSDIGNQLYVDPKERSEVYRLVLSQGMVKNHEVRLWRRDGEMVWLSLSLRAVNDENGAIDHVEGFAVDVTDRRRAEDAQAASERQHRQYLRWMRDILYCLDPEGRIVYVNHAVTHYGYAMERLLGSDVLELARPEDRIRLRRSLAERRTGERRTSGVEFMLHPGPGWDRETPAPVMLLEAEGMYETDAGGGLRYLGTIGMARDISRRKLAEEQLTQSLEAKELLLQELRHRVKNNLQVILSLISLTCARASTPEAVQLCRDIEGYIRCIAAMHTLLSRAPAGDHVDLADMVREVYASSAGLFPTAPVTPSFDMENVPLHLDKALPCGMLLNELFTNIFKHAFPNGRPGRVRVGLALLPDGRARLEVADDGVGSDQAQQCGLGLGMGLIRSLAAQLGAELAQDCTSGFRTWLVFSPFGAQDRLQGVVAPRRAAGQPAPQDVSESPADAQHRLM